MCPLFTFCGYQSPAKMPESDFEIFDLGWPNSEEPDSQLQPDNYCILRSLRTPPTQMAPTLVAAGCGGNGRCGPAVCPRPGEQGKCKV